MVQLWVNLPAKFKGSKPSYQSLLNAKIPRIGLQDNSGELRVIAGEFGAKPGPAKTHTPINLWDITLNAGSYVKLPFTRGDTKAVLVLRGEVSFDDKIAQNGDLLVIDRELEGVDVKSVTSSKLLVLAGEPIDEPIVGYGPFVMNSQEEIRQAFLDYQSGKYGSF